MFKIYINFGTTEYYVGYARTLRDANTIRSYCHRIPYGDFIEFNNLTIDQKLEIAKNWEISLDKESVVLAEVGTKFDSSKLPLQLLPTDVLEQVAAVLLFGSKKYGVNNWRKGIKYSRLYGAALRHLWAWWRGIDNDEETGLPHLAHAICCITFIMASKDKLLDDRSGNS